MELILEGCTLSIYDPKVSFEQIEEVLGSRNISSENSLYEGTWENAKTVFDAAKGSDAVVIVTEWDEFKNLEWKELAKILRKPAWVFDARSVIDVEYVKSQGINVWRIGLGY